MTSATSGSRLRKSLSSAGRRRGLCSVAAGWYIGYIMRPRHERGLPLSRLMLRPGKNLPNEKRPSVTITFGSISSICASRYVEHASSSL